MSRYSDIATLTAMVGVLGAARPSVFRIVASDPMTGPWTATDLFDCPRSPKRHETGMVNHLMESPRVEKLSRRAMRRRRGK